MGTKETNPQQIPSMEKLLGDRDILPLSETFGRTRVKEIVSESLRAIRDAKVPFSRDDLVKAVTARLSSREMDLRSLRKIVNGSGVLVHTNLGRSPIDPQLWAESGDIVSHYSNLEFDLTSGRRGKRDEHLSAVARELFGCEAALLTNNNAAATLLLLSAVARGKEVVVSRGELVEIGGSFRIPEVIEQGGAKLREVGSTNKTRLSDYAEAITRKTAAILTVHQSNFEIVGFTESTPVEELAALAKKKKIALLVDEGGGRVVDLSKYGLRPAATVRNILEAGADAVTCSTDKLIGATQGGLLLGSEEIIGRCRRHPLMRALRAGKESYAIITATLLAFLADKQETTIPIYRMMAAPLDGLEARARKLMEVSAGKVTASRCLVGGGTTPAETIASFAFEPEGGADAIARQLLTSETPIVGRIVNDRYGLDLRTILPGEDDLVARALSYLVRKET
ncbi:MAG TPA: L-seryl-tRNA(Sec) selenium transferase [Thermoanaerobaculia bacterium]|nr:L-seryl-tRNA(Sec) selenium transferase [Thermoanaerobaculia bacterium]